MDVKRAVFVIAVAHNLFASLGSVCRGSCFPDSDSAFVTLQQGGKCLSYRNGGGPGSTVTMSACLNPTPPEQQWSYTTQGTVKSAGGLCLQVRNVPVPAIAGSGNNNGAIMEVNTCTAVTINTQGSCGWTSTSDSYNQVFTPWQVGNGNMALSCPTSCPYGACSQGGPPNQFTGILVNSGLLTLNIMSTNNGYGFGSCVDVDTNSNTIVQLWTCGSLGSGQFQASQSFTPSTLYTSRSPSSPPPPPAAHKCRHHLSFHLPVQHGPTPTPTTSGSCNTAACSGCASCPATQNCASSYYCTGNLSVTNFQCSIVNGVGSWSATCAASSIGGTPNASPSTTSSASFRKPFSFFLAIIASATVVATM